jgi:hypothetical protein
MEQLTHDCSFALLFVLFCYSITLTYPLYLLAKHPEIEATCLEEINSVIGTSTSSSEDNLLSDGPEQLPYTRTVILETLRLYPPAPVTSRTMEKPITLQNPSVTIEKGQAVMLPIWCIQRCEENYPRPNEIHPERWVRPRRSTSNTSSSGSGSSDWEEPPDTDMESNITVPRSCQSRCLLCVCGGRKELCWSCSSHAGIGHPLGIATPKTQV